MTADRPVRIANCSGFYGDRISAAREMVEGGPIDVLTGDWLAELTMLILWKAQQRDPDAGYARTFLTQMEEVLGTCLERGVKIVTNAGGLNPRALADRLGELGERQGTRPQVAVVEGDDILDRIPELQQHGLRFEHLDRGISLADAGVKRVSISLDGADAATHDTFRGIPGAFEAALYGFRNLKEIGVSVQINTTVARHKADQLPRILELAKTIGADALHTFLLVPVGCAVDIAAEQMVPPEEYERMLNWFYDQSLEGGIELKATCAPHYFRVVRQRRVADRHAAEAAAKSAPFALPINAAAEATLQSRPRGRL